MAWYTVVLYIALVLVILGVLISIHEAGHLAVAKMCHVYCFEYSLGFGPKLLHKRRKGGETYFTLRLFPVGGYVSMYGEPGAVPQGETEPDPSRSLNAIAKWKKCAILLAGVTMNFLLGLVLIFVSDIAFPSYYSGYAGYVTTSQGASLEVDYIPMSYEGEIAPKQEGAENSDYYLTVSCAAIGDYSYRVLDSEVYLHNADGSLYSSSPYVATYYPSSLTSDHALGSSIKVYPVYAEKEADVTEAMKEVGILHFPDTQLDALGKDKSFSWSEGTYFDIDLRFVIPKKAFNASMTEAYARRGEATVRYTEGANGLEGNGPTIATIAEMNGWSGAWKKWAEDVPNACTAIVKGFASLFSKNGLSQVSGVVGMTAAMPTINALGGPGYILYFCGLLSINLAFFNLLPFPGLDGWQLVVTIVEGITRKKMPPKAQNIVSLVGFVLLFGFMILITVKDVLALF